MFHDHKEETHEMTETNCNFCDGADSRAMLAEALRSGRYAEQTDPHEGDPLRDELDRYTVTGVAATSVSPCVWAKLEGQWHTIWIDELISTLPHRHRYGTEITALTEVEEDALMRTGGGESRTCPEITAQVLGMESDYSPFLSTNVSQLPADVKRSLGIPKAAQGDWPLDRMSHLNAARVLTEFQHSLGACSCE